MLAISYLLAIERPSKWIFVNWTYGSGSKFSPYRVKKRLTHWPFVLLTPSSSKEVVKDFFGNTLLKL